MDPISLTIRSFSVSILPTINYLLRTTLEALYGLGLEAVRNISDSIYSFLEAHFLSFNQPYFQQAFWLGIIFLTILGLNFIQHSFWCRSLCPLGALLGLCSRYSILRLTNLPTCNACNLCLLSCRGGTYPSAKNSWLKEECMLCWNCQATCPSQTLSFHWFFPWRQGYSRVSLERRYVLYSAFSGLALIPMLRINPHIRLFQPQLIRPPGALGEKDFLRRCVRCGECLKVCLTNGLQPTFLEAGLEGIWSPKLVPRLGYCEYSCTLCGQVCPTGAIKRLTAEEKKKIKIGLAFIDQGRCLPIAFGIDCIVCEEHCPTPKKAIWFEEKEIVTKEGQSKILKQPRVDLRLCIGCGICEYKCPVKDQPAIRISSVGETRSSHNRILLETTSYSTR
jgi:ferredoxin